MLYRIKPLVWELWHPDKWRADTVLGPMGIEWIKSRYYWRSWFELYGEGGHCDSLEEAKAKAEAHYRERLLAALEEVPPGATDSPLEAELASERELVRKLRAARAAERVENLRLRELLAQHGAGATIAAVNHESESDHDRPPGSQRP